jgi:antitoxin HigA-1
MGNYKAINGQGGELIPAHLTHPGEVLEEELEARNLKKSSFAMDIRMYPSHFSDIIKGRRSISVPIALKLEKALGIDAAFWLRMQMDYDLSVERQKSLILDA